RRHCQAGTGRPGNGAQSRSGTAQNFPLPQGSPAEGGAAAGRGRRGGRGRGEASAAADHPAARRHRRPVTSLTNTAWPQAPVREVFSPCRRFGLFCFLLPFPPNCLFVNSKTREGAFAVRIAGHPRIKRVRRETATIVSSLLP